MAKKFGMIYYLIVVSILFCTVKFESGLKE